MNGAGAEKAFEEIAKDIRIIQVGPSDLQVTAELRSTYGRPLSELQPIFGARLVKRVFGLLPEGAFIHSNSYRRDGIPLIAETIRDAESRDELWQRIRSMKLSGSKFYVYRDEDAYRLDMTLQGRYVVPKGA